MNAIDNKKISLVTGGAGFLGTNLCIKLLQLGHTVICLDDFSTGKMTNIKKLLDNRDFCIKTGDVIHKHSFPKLDYIWHLACPASPPKYQANGYKTLQTSLIGTMNMLDLALENKCKLLFTSTSEVYGDPLITPQNEAYWGNVNPIGPRSCYDEGKRCAETLIYEFRNLHPEIANNLKIVRIFNTYGPYMDIDDGRVITNFIKCINENNPITIYGDGTQTRSFCFVDDMIDGFVKMMMSNEIGPINLGNPCEEFSMNHLKDCFFNVLSVGDYPTINVPLPINDPKQRCPDITLAKNRLDWLPKTNLVDGIKKTFNYFN
jgi:UDP-glucuronate decarboxylase